MQRGPLLGVDAGGGGSKAKELLQDLQVPAIDSGYMYLEIHPELPKELNEGICSKSYRGSEYD